MTRFTANGLTLWYGTEDAPAPQQGETLHGDAAITVAVQPPHPSSRVVIRYRVNGGMLRVLTAILISTDYTGGKQIFRALFTDLPTGAEVQYVPVLMCGGRQAPDVATAHMLPSSFRYAGAAPHPPNPVTDPESPPADRYPFRLEYLCRVTASLNQKPEILGETPDGLKVDWYVTGGSVAGPRLNGSVRPEGGDWMTIRQDGIGVVDVRATIDTDDGALVYLTTTGVFELGVDGYRNFINRNWPPTPTVRSSPAFLTAHAHYHWLNRLQCLGVGMVRMNELLVSYDVYAVH